MMEFHISRKIRQQVDLNDLLFSYSGNVIFANISASRRLADRLNAIAEGPESSRERVHGAALFAMGLIDELSHALIASYRKSRDPQVFENALGFLLEREGGEQVDRLLYSFTDEFPSISIYRDELSVSEWLNRETDGVSHRETALEELVLLWIANSNTAFAPFKVLFDDKSLRARTAYSAATLALPEFFETRPPVDEELGSLFEALMAPMRAAPDSLAGQLEFIREHWAPVIGDQLGRTLLAIDTLREEEIAIWMQFHPAGTVWHRHGAPGTATEGFDGDEFIGFEQQIASEQRTESQRRYAEDYQAPLNEYEAFSADQAWMPTVVLIAKNTYVWLEQLSKKYQRHIFRLDQIPDEELRILSDRGITGLWLIGLWERSAASKTIKRLRGNNEAVASAYSLKNYSIAEDLGGDLAFTELKKRALNAGLRLASDMVPNHMGIDSEWVIEHPDWFLSRWDSPFPSYRFDGPDISTDPRVEIKIEDHYYDHSDAAVVFRLRHHHDGATRFVYHGNDGTMFAWNDTAQLDYSKQDVREHVIQVILEVARRFPIIRFDAAMVLAKRHVQRLWFPLPGAGGSIPSRAESAISEEAFDALMPHEFWREVVDRVATEVPGTLLLAEAFWLLEGYFVRTLGMHRVYNSAFMNMLRDEENAKYRSYLKKTVEFDPDILKRYVNFMSNPDERTAIDQFGSGDKYFGVSVLLATLPGLPMFGHGQIEGFTERYGMDFKQARFDEYPNDDLVARHQHLIGPLLKSRHIFAESEHFLLYDFWRDHGSVDENVFAYSNRSGHERAVIIYNNSYQSTHGTVHHSVGFLDKATGALQQRSLAYGLDLSHDEGLLVAFRDNVVGLEYLHYASNLRQHGLSISLRGYQHVALLDWRELRSSASQPWDQLCAALQGGGVFSLSEALSKLQLGPLLEALRKSISSPVIEDFILIANPPEAQAIPEPANGVSVDATNLVDEVVDEEPSVGIPQLIEFGANAILFQERLSELIAAGSDSSSSQSDSCKKEQVQVLPELISSSLKLPELAEGLSTKYRKAWEAVFPVHEPTTDTQYGWARVLAWLVFQAINIQKTSFDSFEEFNLRWALAETFSSLGMEEELPWEAAAQIRLLLKFENEDVSNLLQDENFWREPDVRWLVGVNLARGVEFINRERLEKMVFWIQLPKLLNYNSSVDREKEFIESVRLVDHYVELLEGADFEYEKFLYILTPVDHSSKNVDLIPSLPGAIELNTDED